MNALLASVAKLLRQPWFWTVIAVVVLLLLARKYWPDILRAFKPDRTDYSDDPALTDADKQRLNQLAADLFAEFDGLTWTTGMFDRVALLNDRELKYLARVYPHYANGETLRAAIADEAIAGDQDARLIARLDNMAE